MARAETAKLRRGWTTGACAAGAARAAFAALLTGRFPDPVTIRLPRGEGPSFPLALAELAGGIARAGIVKDAGDDPDVTQGALIIAELGRTSSSERLCIPTGPLGLLRRRRTARVTAPKLREGVGLSNEACELGQRIVAGWFSCAARRRRLTCTIRSLALIVGHSVPSY